MSDSKALRRYQTGVERALALFDVTNEWADYIAFLSRLLKALQVSPPGADVPFESTLSKYLAQCLRPSLPSGVHQKVLEVYDVVFTILGQEQLAQKLPIYLPGILQTLSFASLNIRPLFLALYENHILKLKPSSLRPALKAVILSLLPGIEEENSEDFEKTLGTINRLRDVFAKEQVEHLFWQNLFLASITSSTRRTGALVYLSRHLPKLGITSSKVFTREGSNGSGSTLPAEDAAAVTTPEPGLLLRCFATGLEDDQPLVQRGFLDLLVTHLPLHATTLQSNAPTRDLDILVFSAMTIVLKRDMGLNRRLWTWFCGNEDKLSAADDSPVEHTKQVIPIESAPRPDPSTGSSYFHTYALPAVVRTFDAMLRRSYDAPGLRARPFRMLISLMDRSIIGGPVVDQVFDRMLEDLKTYQSRAPSQQAFDEVFRSANVFFDSTEPQLIAKHLLKLYYVGNWDLLEYVIANFNVDDQELAEQHLLHVLCVLSSGLLNNDGIEALHDLSQQTSERMALLTRILSLLTDVLPNLPPTDMSRASTDASISDFAGLILRSYGVTASGASVREEPVTAEMAEHRFLTNVESAITLHLDRSSSSSSLDHLVAIYQKLMKRREQVQVMTVAGFTAKLSQSILDLDPASSLAVTVVKCRAVANLLGALLSSRSGEAIQNDPPVLRLIPILVAHFWQSLSPSTPQYHAESTDAIWMLRSKTSDSLIVDGAVMSMLQPDVNDEQIYEHPSQRFGVLWTHAKANSAFRGSVDGQQFGNIADNATLMNKALLWVLDATNVTVPDDAWCSWLTSLPSLTLPYQLVLETINETQGDRLALTIGLLRLQKLVSISKKSKALTAEFGTSANLAVVILDQCLSVIVQSSQEQDTLCLSALKLIKIAHEGSEVVLSDNLVEKLCEQIPRTSNGSQVQSILLDTVQTLVTLRRMKAPPAELLHILIAGISSPSVDGNIDKWITLLCNSIPQYPDSIFFSSLLKMTECFCGRVEAYFKLLKTLFISQDAGVSTNSIMTNPERSINNLLSGLEYILARAHTKTAETARPSSTGADGVVTDATQQRTRANNRLTVVLCMQDAIKACGQLWFWRSVTTSQLSTENRSFTHMSSKIRTKSRRMLEHLIDAEPQECLETLIGVWVTSIKAAEEQNSVMSLLQTLDGARPKFMMPVIFNAIYSRTNPTALDAGQRSTLSVDLTSLELVVFLTEYTRRLEDDLLEEIWTDCASFLRDILANPMPHRQILLRLLEFLAVLCQTMENTSFGEQVRMRRELVDLCSRLFTAIFTIKPSGFDQSSDSTSLLLNGGSKSPDLQATVFQSGSGATIICNVLPSMSSLIGDSDRMVAVYAGINANIIGPTLSSRSFPQNITHDLLQLLLLASKSTAISKLWRKEVLDVLNNPKFFSSSVAVVESDWTQIFRQLATVDRSLVTELLSRLAAPSSAGLMFGVGAAAARAEADKQTRANLKRLAMLLLAMDSDAFIGQLGVILVKVQELFTATQQSSPSSATRGDVYILLRAICMSFTPASLAGLWPILDSELRELFEDMTLSSDSKLSVYSHLQGAKLLDLLLLSRPDEFQLHEWLFVTDTVDAVYPPVNLKPTAAADLLPPESSDHVNLSSTISAGQRKPWLCTDASRNPALFKALLGSFFGQLSIRTFEDVYSLEQLDLSACRTDLLSDIFFSESEQTVG